MADPIRIGLLGFGNIGAGVIRSFHQHRDLINGRLLAPLQFTRIADLDTTTVRDTAGFDVAGLLTADAAQVVEGADVDVVIELIGGYEPARSLVERALKAGKHVVTANKAMISKHGPELQTTARANAVELLFEASVGGGVPIVRALQEGLAANAFHSVAGILNGTCNYILTQMAFHGDTFEDALRDAQEKGYAEPDPTFDIEGLDTAQKIAILASLAFGRPTRGDEVHTEGVTAVTPDDLAFAGRHGYAIKMIGLARRNGDDGALELRAHPALVHRSSLLASVNDVFNAVLVDGEPIGPTLYFGRGAGADATSSAILADVIALAEGMAAGGLATENRLLRNPSDLPIVPMDQVRTACYLRMRGDGETPDLLQAALDGCDVGLQAIDTTASGLVQAMTTEAPEGAINQALRSLADNAPARIRILGD